jgi:RyR domain-containing protein
MILVTGDAVLDHNMYEGTRLAPDDRDGCGSGYAEIPGGTLLTYRLLEKLAGDQVRFGLAQTAKEELREWPQQFHTRATWHLVPNGKEPKDGKHWALDCQLGYGETERKPYPARLASALPETPEILVLDDAGLGFREAVQCWPDCLNLKGDARPEGLEWIILKMSRPLATGALWAKLGTKGWRERLVLIVSSEQLRNEGLRVAGGLSWETTAIDIVRELGSNPDLKLLTECRHLIVTMGSDAALWIDKEPGEAAYGQLIFDRERCEGEWEEDELRKKWKGYGYLSAITASVAWFLSKALAENRIAIQKEPDKKPPAADDFTIALAAGLSTTRFLREKGHGPEGKAPAFPFAEAAAHLNSEGAAYGAKPEHAYACAGIEGLDPPASGGFTILGQVSRAGGRGELVSYEPARRVARLGPDKLRGVPCATFEKLRTLDRREIDSLRYLRQLMLAYHNSGTQKRPLCLAVFGAPGSGKSFGLKQIAAAVFSSKNPILEFNLSQYSDPSDLIGAYHQVRDKVLQGFTPVVFWDEFDSDRLRWLQYFLAPMQDGTFQQGEVTHTLGKCVFVFAGGTKYTFESFRKPKDADRFQRRKGPDFVSRLAGFLDIAGPNRRLKPDGKTEDTTDREFPIRRALVIRAALELGKNEALRIESSLLNALLAIPKYHNGARSLEKLVTAIRDRGGIPLRRAHLPPNDVLSLYVEDVAKFHELMERFHDKAEALAPLIHERYLASLTAEQRAEQGGRPLARAWDESDTEITDPNVMAARRMPDVLAVAGYKLVEGDDGDDAVKAFPDDDVELMADAEHRGWEESKRLDGWSYWRSRNNKALRHPLLKPYESLPEADKNLDRDAIGQYPAHARFIGYRIVRARGRKGRHRGLCPETPAQEL